MLNLLKNPLITQRISKFVALKKSVLKESELFFKRIDEINSKINQILNSLKTLRNDDELKIIIYKYHVLFSLIRIEIADTFTDIQLNLEFWTNLTRNYKRKVSNIDPFVTPKCFLVAQRLISQIPQQIFAKKARRTPFLFASLLSRIHYDNESGCGDFNSDLQDIFERVFIYRDDLISKSLNNLKEAMKDYISFSSIEGFNRALASKLIQDYRVTKNISQLLLCVQRLVYPRIYLIRPNFFPFTILSYKKENQTSRELDLDEETFNKGLDLLNSLMFMTCPIDMINVLLRAGSLFVDSYMIKHNMGVGVDFGAQELLPILEKAISLSILYTPISLFRWLDKYCQEMECEASASYIVTSFLTVSEFAFEERTETSQKQEVNIPPKQEEASLSSHGLENYSASPLLPLEPFKGEPLPEDLYEDQADESSDDIIE